MNGVYNLYNGDMGRLRYGMQYKYVTLTGFPGVPGVPTLGPPPTTPNQGLSTNNQAFSSRFATIHSNKRADLHS